MTENTSDIFTATGRHRVWIGEQASARAPRRESAAARPWPGRPQASNTRHAAITKNLAHFSNYKSWADKAKSNWKKDKPE